MPYERIELGKKLYLFRDITNPVKSSLIITAHGGSVSSSSNSSLNCSWPTQPGPRLHFYTPHGQELDSLDEFRQYLNMNSAETLTIDNCPNYSLSKFTDTRNSESRPFRRHRNDVLEDYDVVGSFTLSHNANAITVRARHLTSNAWFTSTVYLSEILNELIYAGYTNYTDIHCIFCR